MSKKRIFSDVEINNKEKCENCERKKECAESSKMLTAFSILLDCEGFYYVFCELEKIEQRPKLGDDVEQYKKEIEEYEKSHENIPFLNPAMVTNGALAVELAMKFLIFKENNEFECGHDLAVLFSQLPQVHINILNPIIYKDMCQNEKTFNDNIKNMSNIFVNYRYFFEYESVGHTNFFTDLVHIVCDYAISMKDELRSKMDNDE
jgi:hypothetical protein